MHDPYQLITVRQYKTDKDRGITVCFIGKNYHWRNYPYQAAADQVASTWMPLPGWGFSFFGVFFFCENWHLCQWAADSTLTLVIASSKSDSEKRFRTSSDCKLWGCDIISNLVSWHEISNHGNSNYTNNSCAVVIVLMRNFTPSEIIVRFNTVLTQPSLNVIKCVKHMSISTISN